MNPMMIEPANISSSSSFNINPKIVEERMGPYHIRVINEQVVKPNPRDTLRFDVTVTLRQFSIYDWRLRLIRTSTLLETSTSISFQSLFEDNQDFLLSVLSNPECSHYFIPRSFDQISRNIVSVVQRALEVQGSPSSAESADFECEVFPLTLDIFVDMLEEVDEETLALIEEESIQQEVAMIPASNEAIHSLQAFTDPLFLKTEKCNICMDEFYAQEGNEDDVKLLSSSSMPCGHVFHHQCIVKWLQTSHTCPLCRYPMPSVHD